MFVLRGPLLCRFSVTDVRFNRIEGFHRCVVSCNISIFFLLVQVKPVSPVSFLCETPQKS